MQSLFYNDIRLPSFLEKAAQGGPAFGGAVFAGAGGGEFRRADGEEGLSRYIIDDVTLSPSQRDALIALFRVCRGKLYGFRMRDRADDEAEGAAIGTGDGAATVFQLSKPYSYDGTTVSRVISAPVDGTIIIKADGVTQQSGYSENLSTGEIIFAAPPASGVAITASFQFDVPVRFDIDALALHMRAPGRYVNAKPLLLREIAL